MSSPRRTCFFIAMLLCAVPRLASADQLCEGVVFVDQNANGIQDAGEEGLGGAILFYETRVAGTADASGNYSVNLPDSGGILWVRGQDGLDPGPFWALVEAGTGAIVDLPVRAATGTGEFSFVAASDTHAGIGRMSPEDQIVGMVQAAGVEPKPYFVTVTGDITAGNAPTHFESVFAAIDAIDIPYVPVPGNHDWYDGGANYRLYFGPPSYAFDAGGVHFVVLNDATSLANRLAFLDLDRSYVVDERPIVVLMHAPPREDLRLALDQRDIDVLLTGHMHTNRVLMHDTFVEYNTQPLVMGGMDLSPAGFRVFHFASDGSMSVDHRTTVNRSIVSIISPAEDQSFAPCTARVIVAVEPGAAITGIVATVDGLGELALRKTGGWNYESNALSTLCDVGEYMVTLDVSSSDGKSQHASRAIVIREPAPLPAVADWPMLQGNARHTGSRPDRLLFPLRTEWVATVGGNIHGGAPVVADGRVFVSVTDFGSGLLGGVVALDAQTGARLWEHRVGFSVRNAPAVVGDTVVFLSNDGTLHGVDAETGEGQWSYELAPHRPTVQRNIYSSPTVDDNGIVFAGGRHEFVAIDPTTGSTLWSVEAFEDYGDLSSHASAAVSGDTVLIPFNRRGGLFAYDKTTGAQQWSAGPGLVQAIHGSPVVDGEVVYVVNELTRLTAVGILDGQERWGLTLEADVFSWGFLAESTPVLQGSTLLVGTQRGGLYAIDTANRELRWSFAADTSLIRATHYHGETGAITAAPVITGDYVWLAGQDGWLRTLDLVTGTQLWSTELGVPMSSSPAIAGDLLVVASYDGSVRGMRHPEPRGDGEPDPVPDPDPNRFGVGGGASCGCQSGNNDGASGLVLLLLAMFLPKPRPESVTPAMWKRFFGKKKIAAAAQPADLVRRLFVKGADSDGVRRAVAGYAEVMGKTQDVIALVLGVESGWLIIDIPASVSAYYFHNLGSWFEAGHEVVTSSWSHDDHWHYVLLEEAEPSDYLIGVHQSGARLTVGRPMHAVIRGEEATVPWTSASDILAGKNIPVDLAQRAASTFPACHPVSLLVEVGDDGLNPGLQTTHERRPDPRYYTI